MPPPISADQLRTVDALMAASRALVGITARSLATLDSDVTMPQFRVLVVLATRGPQRPVDISAELKVVPSTGTRMCERLVRKGLLRRARTPSDRRAIRLHLTPAGRTLVEQVHRHRREELRSIVEATAEHWHPALAEALHAFAAAAGETPEPDWLLGGAGTDADGPST
jgi:DNA-binding MarR family transcriptional regulator